MLDVSTALGITDEAMGPLAIDAAETAAALALITDTDAETWVSNLSKAAAGSEKAMRALGVSVTEEEVTLRALADTGKTAAESLTEGELAAARYALVLEELDPRIKEVITGSGDFEQKSAELEARMETLQAKIGEKLNPVISEMLQFVLSGITGWEMFGAAMAANEQTLKDIAAPAARLVDILGNLIGLFQQLNEFSIPRLWVGSVAIRSGTTGTGPRTTSAARSTEGRKHLRPGRFPGGNRAGREGCRADRGPAWLVPSAPLCRG